MIYRISRPNLVAESEAPALRNGIWSEDEEVLCGACCLGSSHSKGEHSSDVGVLKRGTSACVGGQSADGEAHLRNRNRLVRESALVLVPKRLELLTVLTIYSVVEPDPGPRHVEPSGPDDHVKLVRLAISSDDARRRDGGDRARNELNIRPVKAL